MPEVTKARTGQFIRKLFEILLAHPEGMRAGEAMAALAKVVQLTTYEAGEYDSGGRRFEKIVRFATVDCVKAGWLVKEKGIWTVTEQGAEAYRVFPDPEQFYREAVKLYWKWKHAQPVADERAIATARASTRPPRSRPASPWRRRRSRPGRKSRPTSPP